MITANERARILALAYVPEHLPDYVTAIAPAEPALINNNYLTYWRKGVLVFIGYPLAGEADESALQQALVQARARFEPALVSLIAPNLPASLEGVCSGEIASDAYYRLDLEHLQLSKKLCSLLKRARRDLSLESETRLGKDHRRLIDDFLRSRHLDQETQVIFNRLPQYVETGTAWVCSASNPRGELAAFAIADFSAQETAFYQFNLCSQKAYIPGASDLLLWQIIEKARAKGKRYLNLGLGINPGVRFFKTKWGAAAFLPYRAGRIETPPEDTFSSLMDLLLK